MPATLESVARQITLHEQAQFKKEAETKKEIAEVNARLDKLILDLKGTRSANADSMATLDYVTEMQAKGLIRVEKRLDKIDTREEKKKSKIKKKKDDKIANRLYRGLYKGWDEFKIKRKEN